jgi:hypothetical protein
MRAHAGRRAWRKRHTGDDYDGLDVGRRKNGYRIRRRMKQTEHGESRALGNLSCHAAMGQLTCSPESSRPPGRLHEWIMGWGLRQRARPTLIHAEGGSSNSSKITYTRTWYES